MNRMCPSGTSHSIKLALSTFGNVEKNSCGYSEDIDTFDFRDGVWIMDYKYALPLASALRCQLSELSGVKQSFVGKDAKMEQERKRN